MTHTQHIQVSRPQPNSRQPRSMCSRLRRHARVSGGGVDQVGLHVKHWQRRDVVHGERDHVGGLAGLQAAHAGVEPQGTSTVDGRHLQRLRQAGSKHMVVSEEPLGHGSREGVDGNGGKRSPCVPAQPSRWWPRPSQAPPPASSLPPCPASCCCTRRRCRSPRSRRRQPGRRHGRSLRARHVSTGVWGESVWARRIGQHTPPPSRNAPLASFRLEVGQCTTWPPLAAMVVISSSFSCVMCTATSFGFTRPSRSRFWATHGHRTRGRHQHREGCSGELQPERGQQLCGTCECVCVSVGGV